MALLLPDAVAKDQVPDVPARISLAGAVGLRSYGDWGFALEQFAIGYSGLHKPEATAKDPGILRWRCRLV